MSMRLMFSARGIKPSPLASQWEKSLVRNCRRKREEMKWKKKLAWLRRDNAFAKLVEVGGGKPKGHAHLDAFAEIETFEGGLAGKLRMLFAEGADDAAEILAKRGDGRVVTNVEGGKLFREGIAIGVGKDPLGKIVGESLGKKVVAAEGLEGVVKDGSVAALLEPGEKFGEGASGEIADAREIGNGEKFESEFHLAASVDLLEEFHDGSKLLLGSGAAIRISVRSERRLAAQR